MLKRRRSIQRPFPAIGLLFFLSTFPGASLSEPGYSLSAQIPTQSAVEIPKATKPCTADEARWWEALRLAGNARAARARKGEEMRKRSPNEKFFVLLREGTEKSYSAPVADSRFLVLYYARPEYSDEARDDNISGTVILRVEFRADGSIGEVNVVRGLGHGLDEQAIAAVRKTLFLPAIKDGKLITLRQTVEVEFSRR